MSKEPTAEKKAEIDAMSTESMLRMWLLSPIGTFRSDSNWVEYFKEVMAARRFANPAEWTRVSKEIGWWSE